jgi:hypothetical protein
MSAALEIPQDVIDEVVAALNRAIGIAMRFEPTMVDELSATAVRLDEAINDALATEP